MFFILVLGQTFCLHRFCLWELCNHDVKLSSAVRGSWENILNFMFSATHLPKSLSSVSRIWHRPSSFRPVLWSGISRQSESSPADLPVCWVQPGDIAPWGSWHHRKCRGQSGPTQWPSEVHGDVPHGLLPTGQIWVPVSHGRRGMKTVRFNLTGLGAN